MRFTAAEGHKILQGHKRTHRIPAGPIECPHRVGDILTLEFPETAVDSYQQPILDGNGQHKKILAHDTRLEITKITEERVEHITDQTARLEGYDGFADFLEAWKDRVAPAASWLTNYQMSRPVWVLHFRPHYPDNSRFLAPASGYTTSQSWAIDDRPCVSDQDLKTYAANADEKRQAKARQERKDRELLAREDRAVAARQDARLKGVSIRSETRLLRKALEHGDRQAAERALAAAERKAAQLPRAA